MSGPGPAGALRQVHPLPCSKRTLHAPSNAAHASAFAPLKQSTIAPTVTVHVFGGRCWTHSAVDPLDELEVVEEREGVTRHVR